MIRGIMVANNQEYLDSNDWSGFIDSFPVVVRFGKCRNMGTTAGVKTTYLFTLKDRGAIEEGLHQDRYEIIKNEKPLILLTDWNGDREAHNKWIAEHKLLQTCPFVTLPNEYRKQARNELANMNSKVPNQPSIGVVAWQWLKKHAGIKYHLFGFAHEGTDHHDWGAERRYFEHEISTGKLGRV